MTDSLSFHSNPIVSEDISNILGLKMDWEKLKGNSVLITGAGGFLPAYLVYVLLALNQKFHFGIMVFALVRNGEKGKKKFEHFLHRSDFHLLVQDVCSPIEIDKKVDVVIHAASQASPKFYGSDPVGTLKANVLGTMNLLDWATKQGASQFLYFSSSEVYGSVSPEKIPTTETDFGYLDPTQVRACYAESKRMGENICVSWMHQYGLPVVIVRPFHTYGPGMDLNDGRVYADFIANIVHKQNITMKSDGSAVRAFCYITDAVAAFFLVLLKGEASQAYNVGNENGVSSILDLANTLVQLFPTENLRVIQMENKESGYLKSPVSQVIPNTSKLKKLGWNAHVSIENGFLRTINSYT